jgi:hypothetical protein
LYEGEYHATTMSFAGSTHTLGLVGNLIDEERPGAWKTAPRRKDKQDTASARAKPAATLTMAGCGRAQAQARHSDRPYLLQKVRVEWGITLGGKWERDF